MLSLTQWARSFQPGSRPWLLLGKGPSFDRRGEVDTTEMYTCALNHVVREGPVTVAHIIDFDVVVECAEAITRNAKFLVVPYRPHFEFRPTDKTIVDLIGETPFLKRLDEEGRLVAYNLSTGEPIGFEPAIEVRYFSAEAALNLLAEAGVREVRSLGIDGGDRYSGAFADLEASTLLSNQHESFDLQFAEIAKTIRRTGVFYAPWHVPAPVKVFVGGDRAQLLPARVLEFSIRKHASLSVEVVRIDNGPVPEPRAKKNRTRTGFSFARFRIPELCGYAGRAIYLDADMLVFNDLARLWTVPMGEHHLLYTEQPEARQSARYSVLLLDCEGLHWDAFKIVGGLDAGDYTYEQLMGDLCVVPSARSAPLIPSAWNSIERRDDDTCLIHYTDMPTQPWICRDNPNGEVWYETLREAIAEGFISEKDVAAEVALGHVSPDLPAWLGLSLRKSYRRRVTRWVAPYKRFVRPRNPVAWLRSKLDRRRVPSEARDVASIKAGVSPLGAKAESPGSWEQEAGWQRRTYDSYDQYVAHQQSKLATLDLTKYERRFGDPLRERLKESGLEFEGKRVLCLGARLGTEVRAFWSQGAFAVGIDLNPGDESNSVLHGDFHELQFPDHCVDVVFTNALDHALDIGKLLGEVRRVLCEEGVFVAEIVRGSKQGLDPGAYEALWWDDSTMVVERVSGAGFRVLSESAFSHPWVGTQVRFQRV